MSRSSSIGHALFERCRPIDVKVTHRPVSVRTTHATDASLPCQHCSSKADTRAAGRLGVSVPCITAAGVHKFCVLVLAWAK